LVVGGTVICSPAMPVTMRDPEVTAGAAAEVGPAPVAAEVGLAPVTVTVTVVGVVGGAAVGGTGASVETELGGGGAGATLGAAAPAHAESTLGLRTVNFHDRDIDTNLRLMSAYQCARYMLTSARLL
jgi:hypothetical protein